MKALIKTKSNYCDFNGQWLEIYEVKGKRVTCFIPKKLVVSKTTLVDFTLSEIVEMNIEPLKGK